MKDKPNRREYIVRGTTAALGMLAAAEGAQAQQDPAHEHHQEQAQQQTVNCGLTGGRSHN